jgi:hypothetical protein
MLTFRPAGRSPAFSTPPQEEAAKEELLVRLVDALARRLARADHQRALEGAAEPAEGER